MKYKSKNNDDLSGQHVQENFCGACFTVPLALIGAGTAAVGSQQRGQYKKYRKIALWGGILITILSVLVTFWFLIWFKQCSA